MKVIIGVLSGLGASSVTSQVTQAQAFHIGTHGITYVMCAFVAAFIVGYTVKK